MNEKFKYIYGPVPSWRLGSSLGIDLLSQKDKICNFDCIYCQLGRTKEYISKRNIWVPVKELIEELRSLPKIKIDYVTFSGRGEPALAENLGEAIKEVKLIREEKIAVITNGSLVGNEEVRNELSLADLVMVKLDAYSQDSLSRINRPFGEIEFSKILNGIKELRKNYMGKLALQIMFTEENKDKIDEYIYLMNYIKPDEVQVNTPLRRCKVKPLPEREILEIKKRLSFASRNIFINSVYDKEPCRKIASVSDEDTLRRRGKIK